MIFTLFGYWPHGGGVHNLHMQFFTPDSSKIEVFETIFYDIVIAYNDHPSYVKHYAAFMSFFPYVVCVLLGVDSLRGGLAKGNRITSQRLLDQSEAGVHTGKCHIPPHFGLFGPIRVPYPKRLNC